MLKIGSYRAPRDKVICVLNCCKVIFGPSFPTCWFREHAILTYL